MVFFHDLIIYHLAIDEKIKELESQLADINESDFDSDDESEEERMPVQIKRGKKQSQEKSASIPQQDKSKLQKIYESVTNNSISTVEPGTCLCEACSVLIKDPYELIVFLSVSLLLFFIGSCC